MKAEVGHREGFEQRRALGHALLHPRQALVVVEELPGGQSRQVFGDLVGHR